MEFAPMYGMHGTNNPASIGHAASNGCVRMQEEDVEALYAMVSVGTPVHVTYDRVLVRVLNGMLSVGIYPDVYSLVTITSDDVRRALLKQKVIDVVSDDQIASLIDEQADRQVVLTDVSDVYVNGTLYRTHFYTINDLTYLPVWAIAGPLHREIIWNEQTGVVSNGLRGVTGQIRDNMVLIGVGDVSHLFGGKQTWNPDNRSLDYRQEKVIGNKKALFSDVQVVDGIMAIPVMPLADQLDMRDKVSWQPAQGVLTVRGRAVPVCLIDNQPYIKITDINNAFGTYVYWNQGEETIELTQSTS